MKTIKFLLMGEAGVGKSTLLDVFLWRLHYGYAYHDHRIDKQRYLIDVQEILTFNELHTQHIYQNQQEFLINMLCFDVTDRRTLCSLRKEWIPELLALNRNMKIFIVGLQCDQREQFLTKLTQNCVSHADGMSVCLYYENVHYLECSSLKLASVNALFEQALEIFFYENIEKDIEERILKLYAAMQITFEFYGTVKRIDDEGREEKDEEVEVEKVDADLEVEDEEAVNIDENVEDKVDEKSTDVEDDNIEEQNIHVEATMQMNARGEEMHRNYGKVKQKNISEDATLSKNKDKEKYDADNDDAAVEDNIIDLNNQDTEYLIDIYAVEDDHFI